MSKYGGESNAKTRAMEQSELWFDGETYTPSFDRERLGRLMRLVFDCMSDGHWRTLNEIANSIGHGSEASISARLRDLRKDRFGSFQVERRRRGDPTQGLWEYRLLLPSPESSP